MRTFYPFHKDLNDLVDDLPFSQGNFGLWYNKLIPNMGPSSKDAWCACDKKSEKNGRTEFYKTVYHDIKTNKALYTYLERKHCQQMAYVDCMEKQGFFAFTITGTLETALVTGLGEAHPSETSLILDHTLGLPYIPSSGVKGAVRFAHSKGLLFDREGKYTDVFVREKIEKGLVELVLDEENRATHIPLFFGGDVKNPSFDSTDTLRGSILFLDAYPVTVPELHMDIINPHYSDYYGDKNEPPGDYLEPVPVKFLTIAPETSFVFRFLLDPESAKNKEQFSKAVRNTLGKEGIGAKTAIGYGRFKNIVEGAPTVLKEAYKLYLEVNSSEEEKMDRKVNEFVALINGAEKGNASVIDSLFSQWENFDPTHENVGIAKAFAAKIAKKKSNGEFTRQYSIVAEVLGIFPEKEAEDNTSEEKVKSAVKTDDNEIVSKLEAIIKRGYCSKKEKNKLQKMYKDQYPDLYTKIKKLPVTKP